MVRQQLTALRVRHVGIALFFFGGGLGMIVSGILGADPTRLFYGLLLLGMGALYIYGQRGFGPWWPVA